MAKAEQIGKEFETEIMPMHEGEVHSLRDFEIVPVDEIATERVEVQPTAEIEPAASVEAQETEQDEAITTSDEKEKLSQMAEDARRKIEQLHSQAGTESDELPLAA